LALHLHNLLPDLQINLVLDVGARVGEYGVWLRHNGYKGNIASFEPVSANFVMLTRQASADPRWQVFNTALGADEGSAEINVTRATHFSSFLRPNQYANEAFGDRQKIDHSETVSVRRLDKVLPTLIERLQPTGVYLKMDTQGWDLEVLKGAAGVINHIAALQSEVSVKPIYCGMPSFTDSLQQFEKLGFALSGLFPVSLDTRHRVVEFDCVCVADAS
jgi:FkbM family methyltransferase